MRKSPFAKLGIRPFEFEGNQIDLGNCAAQYAVPVPFGRTPSRNAQVRKKFA